ncbi:GAF domain-containing protein [Lyngbya aestuarii]|uniref:GAF domain-containing protein n=1 Tax=Lyngbya aestuarii TaxID=118322 RepID=UPI00403D7A84
MKPAQSDQAMARSKATDQSQISNGTVQEFLKDFTGLAAQICETPIALTTLLDNNQQLLKCPVGLTVAETQGEIAFCSQIIQYKEILVVPDALADERFASDPLVASHNPQIRFYAGAPLISQKGQTLGTIGVMDYLPRELNSQQLEGLKALSRQLIGQLDLKYHLAELESTTQETKERELKLYRREQELLDFVENGTVGMHWVNAQGIILWANKAELDLLGYPREEYFGQHIANFHADEVVIKDILKRLTANEILCDYEARLLCKDGSVRHVSINSNVMWEDDQFSHTRCFTRDITQYKQAQERLKLLERAIAASENGIIITDSTQPDNPIIYANKGFERLTGYREAEIIGKNCRFLQGSDRNQAALTEVRAALQEARNCRVTLRNYHQDGRMFWNELSISPVQNAAGNLTHYVGVQTDITELKRVEAELEEAKERKALFAIISKIRQSLELETIFQTAATEVRQLLKAERVGMFRFHPGSNCNEGEFVSEDVVPPFSSALAMRVEDHCFGEQYAPYYQCGKLQVVADIEEAGLSDCHREILSCFQVRANLVVPLLKGDQLWGLLCIHQCSSPRYWQDREIEFVKQIAVQLGVALQQAELLAQTQRQSEELTQSLQELQQAQMQLAEINRDLERRVSKRTNELQQAIGQLQREISERQQAEEELQRQHRRSQLFAEITLKIRQSLQIEEILQTTVTEVQKILQVDRVLLYRVWSNGTGRTVTEAVQPGWPAILGKPFQEEVFPLEYQEAYRQGKVRAVADVEQAYAGVTPCMLEFLKPWGVKAKFVVPILQNKQLWGLLIAHHCTSTRPWSQFETNLLKQLADQIAIALAQAQLLEQETRQRQELARSNAELQEFAYVASHDLQEPLRKIQAFGDRLQSKFSDVLTDQGHDYLERMQNAAGRMRVLIEDLLALSRVTTRAQPFVNCSLTQVVQGVLSDLEVSIQQAGGTIEVGELPTIKADPVQMRQLLQNLIGNALKFRREEEPPAIKICSRLFEEAQGQVIEGITSPEFCQITVEDNGIGFEEKYIDRIFNPFQRLHGRSKYDGTGMGLAICRKIVERHGGGITAEGVLGEGATFMVTLPLKQRQGGATQ